MDDEQVVRESYPVVRLQGLFHEYEWQCAYQSVPHAEKGRAQYLTWETPYGDLTLEVTLKSGVVRVRRV